MLTVIYKNSIQTEPISVYDLRIVKFPLVFILNNTTIAFNKRRYILIYILL